MSDLQLALIVIGVALVVAVQAYNKWQEARFRQRAEAALRPSESDVLLRSTAPQHATPASRVEPTFAGEPPPVPTPGVPAPAAAPRGLLSEAIDFIVTVDCVEPVAGRAFIEAAMQPLGAFRKAVRIEGDGGDGWEALQHERSYRKLRAGMQLVDRRGAATGEDIGTFAAAVGQAAANAGMTPSGGSPEDGADEATATAARLDALCEQVDIQIAVHVVAREGLFPGTRIRALAEAAGLVLDDDGRFRMLDEQQREIFRLCNDEATPFSSEAMRTLSTAGVTLELDIPRAPGDAGALACLRSFAEQFAAGLGGVLVDDNRAPLSAAGFDAIAAQLAPVYEAMRAQGIPAGSPIALRLFS
jgi:hypothetical protein